MSPLDQDRIRSELQTLAQWQLNGDAIEKTITFPTFADGIAFVNAVASLADEADHHPDIDIRYTAIKLSLSTHSAGGLTSKDFDLARKIDAVSR